MNNKDIALKFSQLAKIMELHGENAFRIKSYTKAYNALRNIDIALAEATKEELLAISGVGQSTVDKIFEIREKGEIDAYRKYLDKTPSGVIELLGIKGIGAKKVKTLWEEGIDNPTTLLEKIEDESIQKIKGFGKKTGLSIKDKVEYYLESKPYSHFANLDEKGHQLLEQLRTDFPEEKFDFCGAFGRKMNIVENIDILTTSPLEKLEKYASDKVVFIHTDQETYGSTLLKSTASQEFLEALNLTKDYPTIEQFWEGEQLSPIVPEYRESAFAVRQSKENKLPKLVEDADIKGIIHNHSTYSDGSHTLRQMCDYVHDNGYEYFVISDHSKAAVFAGGIDEKRVLEQWEELDEINKSFDKFHTFKGIECDILSDGSMDFEDDLLKEFDVVVASVHLGLEMDEKKATNRIAKAIENPHVHILGHCSGRLLLGRRGYPLDYPYIIDACAANGVAIELNANPKRLDIDWRWLPYALEKGVMISVNPDAHSRQGIHNVKYGVISARKGGLTPEMCLNSFSKEEFSKWLARK